RDTPGVKGRLRLRHVAPIEQALLIDVSERQRHPNEGVAVGTAGLQEKHPICRVLRQASRKNGARAAPTHDDVIKFQYGHEARSSLWLNYQGSLGLDQIGVDVVEIEVEADAG